MFPSRCRFYGDGLVLGVGFLSNLVLFVIFNQNLIHSGALQ
jgi:hypothetical protein